MHLFKYIEVDKNAVVHLNCLFTNVFEEHDNIHCRLYLKRTRVYCIKMNCHLNELNYSNENLKMGIKFGSLLTNRETKLILQTVLFCESSAIKVKDKLFEGFESLLNIIMNMVIQQMKMDGVTTKLYTILQEFMNVLVNILKR